MCRVVVYHSNSNYIPSSHASITASALFFHKNIKRKNIKRKNIKRNTIETMPWVWYTALGRKRPPHRWEKNRLEPGKEVCHDHKDERTPRSKRGPPVPGEDGQGQFDVTYVKPTITRPNIVVGDFTYFSGSNFESRVTNHYEFYGDKLIIGSDVSPYTIVIGNPAKPTRKRFDDELIALLQAFKWWDKSVDEIQGLIPLLNDSDSVKVKRTIKGLL